MPFDGGRETRAVVAFAWLQSPWGPGGKMSEVDTAERPCVTCHSGWPSKIKWASRPLDLPSQLPKGFLDQGSLVHAFLHQIGRPTMVPLDLGPAPDWRKCQATCLRRRSSPRKQRLKQHPDDPGSGLPRNTTYLACTRSLQLALQLACDWYLHRLYTTGGTVAVWNRVAARVGHTMHSRKSWARGAIGGPAASNLESVLSEEKRRFS